MTTYVLVHGAWHGGWCWTRVADLLTAQGHRVVAPTLSGLSDRSHLLSPAVGLDTHVQDVVAILDNWDLDDVVLVGHSYAGQVVTGVAAARPNRIGHLVYLDAFVANAGERAIDLLPEQVAHHYYESVESAGFGWLIPPRSLQVLGVIEPADLGWLTPRLTPHPWRSYLDPITAVPPAELAVTYLDCVDWMGVFAPYAQRARDRGFVVHELKTGHEAMVTAPGELADHLLAIPASADAH